MSRGFGRPALADGAPGVSLRGARRVGALPVLGVLGSLVAAACSDHDARLGGAGSPSVGPAGAGSPSAGAPDPALTAGAGSSPSAGAGGASVGEAPADAFPTDLLASSALDVLTRRCGQCHGGSRSDGGIGAIDQLDALISSGLIVPGNAAGSPLLDSIRSGRMPPAGRTLTRPDVGELWLLEGFIDGIGADPESCEPAPFLGADDAYAALLADIAAQPEADRPFIRYVTLTDTPGGCAAPLPLRRDALIETVNGVSLDPEIHLPVAIDAAELIYRLDMRDYDWDRPMDLDADGTEDHADGWRALVASAGPYAVELQGPEADALRAATGTAVPVLPGAALVWAANSGDVYYTLLGARANIYDTQLDLGVDDPNRPYLPDVERLARRAGFERDRDEFLATRYPREGSARGYWSLALQGIDDSESIYDIPLDDERSGGQSLYHLPNGLLAYSIEDYDGSRRTRPPGPCERPYCADPDLSALYPVGGSPAGCHACHHRGLAPVGDEVLALGEREFMIRGLDQSEIDDIRLLFSASDLDALMAADNAVYLDALASMGISPAIRSPLAQVFLSFEREPLDLARAAAELGVTPAALNDRLPHLPASFAPLAEPGGTISRDVMAEGLIAARCVLSEGARNRPVECPLWLKTVRQWSNAPRPAWQR